MDDPLLVSVVLLAGNQRPSWENVRKLVQQVRGSPPMFAAIVTQLVTQRRVALDNHCQLSAADGQLGGTSGDRSRLWSCCCRSSDPWQRTDPDLPLTGNLTLGGSVAGCPAWPVGLARSAQASGGISMRSDGSSINCRLIWACPPDVSR